MAIAPRKHEWEAVADAIEQATPQGLEATAEAATKAAYAALQSRPGEGKKVAQALWVVAVKDVGLFGPFGTEAEAYTALQGKVPEFIDDEGAGQMHKEGLVPTLGGQATVLPMVGPLAMSKRLDRQDRKARLFAEHRCETCEHPEAKHGIRVGSDACFIPGCKCKKVKPIKL